MSQPSLFSADARPAGVSDLAGMLCGPGQIARFGQGAQARLSIELDDPTRARALCAAAAAVGIALKPVTTDEGGMAVRTAFRRDLVDLAAVWTDGSAKRVPPGWELDGGTLRVWALAAGRPDERGGYLLLLDRDAPQTHLPLIAAATRAGIPPARVGDGVALRISGARRMQRLVELVGDAPLGAPDGCWPRHWGRRAS